MKVNAARFIPVLVAFPEAEARQESWGRFLELQSNRARLITRTRMEKGDVLILTFDLPGEAFAGVDAEVARAAADEDGYYVCTVLFPEEEQRVRLGRTLQRILAAS
ncbi:MAG: hypothetical protein ABIJ96_04705 [Elusimicrobiota bacterium]